MKYYMINSIVQTILLTAFLIKSVFNTKICKLITFGKISKFTEN